jgi:signal transduction histidine kinase
MTHRARTIAGWTIFGVGTGLFFVAQAVRVAHSEEGNGFGFEMYFAFIAGASIVTMLWLGTSVLRRQPGNRVGWLFIALPTALVVWDLAGGLATIGAGRGGEWTPYAAWIAKWDLVPVMSLFILVFLLFPDGRPPTQRWRPVVWLWLVGTLVATVGFAVSPEALEVTGSTAVANPFAIEGPLVNAVTVAGGLLLFLTAVVTAVAVVLRFRRSSGDERAQLKWLAFVAIAFFTCWGLELLALVIIAITGIDVDQDLVGGLSFIIAATILILGLPAACATAILKYKLYEIDVVIRKTVVFTLLVVFLTVVYAVIAGAIGAIAGSVSSTTGSFLAAGALAILFQPARERARRFADRVVYGTRASPYEVLTTFGERVGDAYSIDDVLPRMVRVLANGTGASSARVLLRVGAEMREVTAVGEADGTEHREAVMDLGEEVGALAATFPANDPINPAKEQLIRHLATQAGLVLRNVRLIEELRASRQRLVAAQDEERRKLERNIHDGVQQQLVALAVRLKLADALVDRDPAKAHEALASLQADAGTTLEDLRDLARGIYPPLLADKGLPAALESQARKAAVSATVASDGVGRYPQDVESAIYFCALEALNNVAKYADAGRADVLLAQRNGHVTFEVRDDGVGFDIEAKAYGTGLQGMRDRLAAVGGTLAITSAPGSGTRVTGTVPISRS